jgi:uncharacterized protein (TIGR02145 family)
MKRHILFLGFLSIVFGLRLDAQTLKNIHRHNLPVLQIPVELIDKVETVDLSGIKTLRITPLFGEITQIPVSEIDSITHYIGSVNPEQLGEMRTASVMGIVRDTTNAPIMNAIVRSPYGGEETRTDPNGVFFLNDIIVYDKLGYITITKPGFHKGSRSFLPLETGSNRVNIQLLPMDFSGSFSATSGGAIASGLLLLNFPANAMMRFGLPYAGTVRVYAESIDPASADMFEQMPGELLGGMNDSLRLLRSFGMAAVELRDEYMNELQLAEGASATLTFNIPSALQADAPETIDWWSFDETLGYWKHEGQAQKQGSAYVGAASHFSWWNCDVPENFNDFHGSVNMADGTPISEALVNVVTSTMGTGSTLTNIEGQFSGRVPKNQLLTLNVYLTCEAQNDWNLVFTEDLSSASEPIVDQYQLASLDERYPIIGTLVNCIEEPVELGYVKKGTQIFLTENGEFTIQACYPVEYVIQGFDISNSDSIKISGLDTVLVGPQGAEVGLLQACNDTYGSVSDIEGHVYPTALIGDQWWMTENLRTATYANGELIPHVTDNIAWAQLNSGAWCNFDNILANDELYGKLYNWNTTVDSRGLCPVGWHVPTSTEWATFINYLDGSAIAGGKMKSLNYWNLPNEGATNESGFSGLPGGYRNDGSGIFYSDRFEGFWWSSSTDMFLGLGVSYSLYYATSQATYDINGKQDGYSIRCIKD